ncbi:MAG: hypothetical protein KDD60_02055, partial [Bdellovibrionales bacterium]|nr:hypothetical protein [Bdellovibrionales bacterium]
AAPKTPQSIGLPQHVATVNVFTERSWIEYAAVLAGVSKCSSSQETCQVDFFNVEGFPHAIPLHTSDTFLPDLNTYLEAKPDYGCFEIKQRTVQVESYTRIQYAIMPNRIRAHELDCPQPEIFLLSIDGSPIAVSKPTKVRAKELPKALFRIDPSEYSPNRHAISFYFRNSNQWFEVADSSNRGSFSTGSTS